MTINADLAGKRVLVVGGSSGLGRSVALTAAGMGAKVAVVGRRKTLIDEVAAEAGGVGIVADVCDESAARRAVDEAVAGLGGIDVVLLTLAWSYLEMMADSEAQNWHKTFATNVVAPTLVTRFALPVLAEGGFVGFVSSTNVDKTMHGVGAYGASKAALEHTIRTWRLEHMDVRFMRLVVGPVLPTDIYRDFDGELLGRVMTSWAEHGLLEASFMAVEDVGTAVAEACAWILAHPAIVVEDIVLKPPIRTMSAAELQALLGTPAPRDEAEPSGDAKYTSSNSAADGTSVPAGETSVGSGQAAGRTREGSTQ
ncbi:SDR family oxidoreductase [Frankia gtarii]|uniref:SDR family oxidoreductase n=1 Tax=Frankia gtarii TaxID=2950102 RepID=UPI0021BEAA9F|nr:SDR family oxidoreductase [Frankia gtarii]